MIASKRPSRALFLVAAPGASPEPWLSDVRREAGELVELSVATTEVDADFSGVTTVIDVGGWASDATIDRGADAGVRLWQVLGYGLDHINVDRIHERGMILAHTPGAASAVALAEHALLLMLLVEKRMAECAQSVANGVVGVPIVGELHGQELVIVGYGASGRALAVRAASFGMRLSAIDIVPPADPLLHRSGRLADLEDLLPDADIVSLHLPLTPTTTHLFDADLLARMKAGSVLINVARGRLVDERALVLALRSGHLRGAGLDVFESEPLDPAHPLRSLPNVALTPHVAGMTRSTSRRRAAIAIRNAVLVDRGEAPNHVIAPASPPAAVGDPGRP